jgi:beta-1,4-mannosyltransferase
VGRSPRMQYHALSLAKEGYSVDIVGYSGSAPHSDLLFSPKISFHYMNPPPSFISSIFILRNITDFPYIANIWIFTVFPRFITYFLKVLWQTWFLVWTLFWISKPSFYLVQNPPSIPTLPVCWFIARVNRTQLAIDWHNYGTYYITLTEVLFTPKILSS